MKSFLHSFRSSAPESTMPLHEAPKSPMKKTVALTVVELFQSQGCSSCPPANSNVLKLAEDPNLLILTYDVTYWDRLGWKDTFGNSAFDRRQWEYAKALQRKKVFTPQVIVNGQVDGVGNNARDLQCLVAKGNAINSMQTVHIDSVMSGKAVTVSGPEQEQGIVVAVCYDAKHYEVPILHGENGGRSLPHSHVVKNITQLGNWRGGSQDFELPHWDNNRLKVAVLVHAGLGGRLLGAVRV
ncbi:hypothetical protein N7G274_003511 [Stereocaulon virgatum]|uniref:DUF1223 domain-containing protein n=1 Tax=Stereocaulon virgatum TaxID=373712 RepID=A0ABR4AER7_9LECA